MYIQIFSIANNPINYTMLMLYFILNTRESIKVTRPQGDEKD